MPVLPGASPDACLLPVRDAPEKQLLKGVSRSFYLSLRLLPRPMRGAACLGYLLARTSDTLADSAVVSAETRLLCLDWFSHALSGEEEPPRWPIPVLNALAEPQERALLEASGDLFAWLQRLPAAEAQLVREVVAIIIGGQKLDLERFGAATGALPVSLTDDAALEDYAWRVAGCVGAFWTKLGFLTLGARFSAQPAEPLIMRGIAYGKGLQLVNILRDLPADLSAGRCYLPLADPHDTHGLLDVRGRWIGRAGEWVGEGFAYADALVSRRLRVASVLPAMIARETLALLRNGGPDALESSIKVPRSRVYLALLRAFIGQTR
ncbi:MAG: squalene/phytoene synthase family protein [Luteolibacter sp.]|nr:squalene/phytoene synthase family protein [Luteolibacter sp.]